MSEYYRGLQITEVGKTGLSEIEDFKGKIAFLYLAFKAYSIIKCKFHKVRLKTKIFHYLNTGMN